MKNNFVRMLVSAAVVTLSAAAAHAQTSMTANIPFSFSNQSGEHAPGPYLIRAVTMDGSLLWMRNLKTGETSSTGFGTPIHTNYVYGKEQRAKLVFLCRSESGCLLSEVWTADGRGRKLHTPRLKAYETERAAVIYFDGSQVADEQ